MVMMMRRSAAAAAGRRDGGGGGGIWLRRLENYNSTQFGMYYIPIRCMVTMNPDTSWMQEAKEAVRRAERLARDARASAHSGSATTEEDAVKTVLLLDEMSDTICRIADRAELARNAHVSASARRDAEEAVLALSRFVHTLNADETLYASLTASVGALEAVRSQRHSMQRTTTTNTRSRSGNTTTPNGGGGSACAAPETITNEDEEDEEDEELLVCARRMCEDFERGGIKNRRSMRSDAEQRDIASIAERCTELGMRFAANANKGHDANMTRRAQNIVASSHNAEERRNALRTLHCAVPTNLDVLDDLLHARHEFAAALGYDSFGELATSTALAGSTEAVRVFLRGANDALRPRVEDEVHKLRWTKYHVTKRLKGRVYADRIASSAHNAKTIDVHEWDRHYLVNGFTLHGHDEHQAGAEAINAYLPIEGSIRRAVDVVCGSLGCRAVGRPVLPHEAWAPGLIKLDIFDAKRHGAAAALYDEFNDNATKNREIADSSQVLGQLFLDTRPREGKSSEPAVYTLRCGRRLENGSYQTPVAALLCSFQGNVSTGKPRDGHHRRQQGQKQLMSMTQLETLLHELGHAMHVILSRTRLQHLSGVRGPQDVVEVPAHVTERLVSQPEVLMDICRHHITGARPSKDIVLAAVEARDSFSALATQDSIFYSMIDQEFHGPILPRRRGGTSEIVDSLCAEYMPFFTHLKNTHRHTRFTHLAWYSGTYYSYLYAHALAGATWASAGIQIPLMMNRTIRDSLYRGNEATGDLYLGFDPDRNKLERHWREGSLIRLRRSILKHGCSRPPARGIAELVGAANLTRIGDKGYAPSPALLL